MLGVPGVASAVSIGALSLGALTPACATALYAFATTAPFAVLDVLILMPGAAPQADSSSVTDTIATPGQ
jgi:hypothetical protein